MKDRKLLVYSLAAVLSATLVLRADDPQAGGGKDPAAVKAARAKREEELKKLSPEQRAALQKEHQQRLEKRIQDLRRKRDNGTLTEQGAKGLEQLENQARGSGKSKHSATKPHVKPAATSYPQKTHPKYPFDK